MGFVRHIIGLVIALLFSTMGTSIAIALPQTVTDLAFNQAQTAHFSQADYVYFAARAPPTTLAKVAVTGDVTVMHGGAFVTHGVETQWASLNFGADHIATNTVTNGLPDNPSQLGHIFRNDVGHLPDTPANRQLLVNTTNNPSNFAGKDRFGNDVYI